jgi:hypothetical protein
MKETRTASMLQRVPTILAVTAHSYGLPWQVKRGRKPEAAGERSRSRRDRAGDKPAAQR